MTSTKGQPCNLMVEQSDLKKLQDLDPFQTQGFQSIGKVTVPVQIIYTDELQKTTTDIQQLNFQLLARWVKITQKNKEEYAVESLRVIITSEEDIFLSFICNCSSQTFESFKQKNQLNMHFNDFPATLMKMLQGASQSGKNQIELKLSHEGSGKLHILESTDYKRLQLIELFFQSSSIEKANQSIIYRYNFNRTKLSMLENSIETLYRILADKNPPLLHFIQKNVGMDE